MYRKSVNEDCKSIYDLICDMENKTLPYEKFCEIFNAQLKDSNCYCLVNEDGVEDGRGDNSRIIGMLNLRFENQLHHSDRIAEIMEFVIEPGRRCEGLGRDMLAKACEVAREHGCVQIEVACNQLRKDTHRFYEREGMNNFHYKFLKSLIGEESDVNELGR